MSNVKQFPGLAARQRAFAAAVRAPYGLSRAQQRGLLAIDFAAVEARVSAAGIIERTEGAAGTVVTYLDLG